MTEEGTAAALLLDKPAGVTSHDVVAQVRRERGQKAGHAGTLDPFATGLLIVLLGRATRLQRYLLALPKTYLAVARLGWRSTTGDPDGELRRSGRMPERLELPSGRVAQQVPMTSAVKVGGERLYRKARRGEEVETPVRAVEVHRAELVSRDDERASFEIECSSGTYVRTLIETLDDAYCESLRRTAIGPFTVPGSVSEELSVEGLMSFMPERELDAAEAKAAAHGRAVPLGAEGASPQRLTRAGRLVAVARVEDDQLRPEVVLA
jgi:tRNA pseudouridine55 synthase